MKIEAHNIGTCPSSRPEPWALVKGIQFAQALGCKHVIFESNSRDIVEEFNNNKEINNVADNLLAACKREIKNFEKWKTWCIAVSKIGQLIF